MKNEMRNEDLELKIQGKGDRKQFVTPRAVILSLVLMVVVLLINRTSILTGVPALPPMSVDVPSQVPFFFLVILAIVSNVLGRRFKLFRFSSTELSMIYLAPAFALLFTGTSFFYPFLAQLYAGQYNYLIDPKNPVYANVVEGFSRFGFVQSEEAIFGLFEGGYAVPWMEWICPIIVWTLFFGAFVFIFALVGSVFYKRWSEADCLTFGMTVPIVSTANMGESQGQKGYDFKNKLFLLGGVFPSIVWIFNQLHLYFPAVPAITLEIDLGRFFTEPPFNPGLTFWPGFFLKFWPYAIGLGYIIPTDISFSVWIFYLVQRLSGVFFYNYNIKILANMRQFTNMHGTGAAIGLALLALWYGRHTIAAFFRAAVKGKEFDEHVPNARLTLIVAVVALGYIVFVSKYVLGMSAWVIPVYILLMLALSIAFARARSESSIPLCTTEWTGTGDMLVSLFGTDKIGLNNAVLSNMVTKHFMWGMVFTPGWTMDVCKIGDDMESKDRGRTIWIMVGTFIVFMVLMHVILLPSLYEMGGGMVSAFSRYIGLPYRFTPGTEPVPNSGLYLLLGTLITAALGVLRSTFIWWPVSPIGYAMAWDFAVSFRFPGSFFLAWLIKTLLLRYGGAGLYRKFLPFFVGMVVFDVALKGLGLVITMLIPV